METSTLPTARFSFEQVDDEREQWEASAGAERDSLLDDMSSSPTRMPIQIKRKSVPTKSSDAQQLQLQIRSSPASPVRVSRPETRAHPSLSVKVDSASPVEYRFDLKDESLETPNYYDSHAEQRRVQDVPDGQRWPFTDTYTTTAHNEPEPSLLNGSEADYDEAQIEQQIAQSEGLQYHAFDDDYKRHSRNMSERTTGSLRSSGSGGDPRPSQQLHVPKNKTLSRPPSSYSDLRGRSLTPFSAHSSDHASSRSCSRDPFGQRRSSSRPMSYVDELNNVPYSQQIAPGGAIVNQSLQNVVGSGASRLDIGKTLEMYRANIKKDTESSVQYEFAVLMVNSAQDATPESGLKPVELLAEAKTILQRLADRAYPFAQYYLGDGYFSGLFNKDKPDYEKAQHLFLAASKHGHAEAGYRAALCYEFGWGCTKSYPKAVQFYRVSAAKNHPGAATRLGLACINGDMGLGHQHYREGVKWLKRAQESADLQYNTAPYELGLLHLTGFGDDIFQDEAYASQLFTQAAELGHTQANFLMGKAYETGLYGCPRDAALSVHFYNGAATKGHPDGMMALCAWYMVGAEPVMEKDEGEAYAWALQAAETGYAKAEYAVGYFTEMGIGCRRDPLEANVWYVRAADQGDAKAKQRLQLIRDAAAGQSEGARSPTAKPAKDKKKFMGIF